jgi:hypothetical protein
MRRVAVGLLCAGVLAAQRPPVAAPERFETILWMHGGPARDARLAEAIRALSCTAVSVSADEDPSWPGAHGLRFYRDQATGIASVMRTSPTAIRERSFGRTCSRSRRRPTLWSRR